MHTTLIVHGTWFSIGQFTDVVAAFEPDFSYFRGHAIVLPLRLTCLWAHIYRLPKTHVLAPNNK